MCPFCGATRPLCRHYLLQGHARTIRVCLASQILPLAGPFRRLSAIAALVQSFRTGGRLHALIQVSISCGCCFSTACRSVVNAATFSSSCTFIPLASDHCRILRAPHHRCKEQNVRALPVHICFIWIWICDTVLSSRTACSLKVLSLSWNLDRNYLGTYMPVCWRPHASMFKSDVPPQDGHCILERKHSASGHAKRASVSVFPSLSHALSHLDNIGFTHRTLVGKRHCRGMQLQSVRATPKQVVYLKRNSSPM